MAFVRRRPLLSALIVVLLTASLLAIGDGLNPVWPLMWVAVIPVLLFAAEVDSWYRAAAAAALAMLLGSLPMFYYLHVALHAPFVAWFIPFSIASLLFAAGVLLFRALLRRGAAFSAVIALPAFWTVAEYLGSFVPADGTAGSLAYTQLRFLPLLQIASLTGLLGISFLLLLFSSVVAAAIYLRATPRRAIRVVALAVVVVGASLIFGAVRMATPSAGGTIKVGLLDTDKVQIAEPGVATDELIRGYAEQAAKLAGQGAQLVLMPEKTVVLLDRQVKAVDSELQGAADRSGATLDIGVLHLVGDQKFNEARIYSPGHPVEVYHKEHMLPPFESDETPGISLTTLSGFGPPVGVEICKDMDFIRPALDYGRAGVALMLDSAWDFNIDRAWHGHIAIMRGVENGYAVAHAAKDGYLTVTDSRGRILGEVRTDSAPFASLIVDVPLRHEQTLFDRFGAWFAWTAGALLLATVVRLAMVWSQRPEVL
jgi:apolipoprotein N-acyltransferase